MGDTEGTPRRKSRRRVRRPSDAQDIDRSLDTPDHGFRRELISDDAERTVPLEENSAGETAGEEFWREQRPPHHGD